jgi:hypothetical protein
VNSVTAVKYSSTVTVLRNGILAATGQRFFSYVGRDNKHWHERPHFLWKGRQVLTERLFGMKYLMGIGIE